MTRHQVIALMHAVTVIGQTAPALALRAFSPARVAWPLAVLAYVCSAKRVMVAFSDPPRPHWVARWIDEPFYAHWAASVLATSSLGPMWGLAKVVGRTRPAASAAVASYGLGLLASAWGVWGERRRLRVREVEVPLARLSRTFDGYRIVQLSDLHIGGFDGRSRGYEWVARANALAADLVVVTGDLVSAGTAYYSDVAEVLAQLKARDGVYVCMGNHDQWRPEQLVAELERRGLHVLRNASCPVTRDGAAFSLAAVDDRRHRHADVVGTLAGCPRGVPIVLLAHDPEDFREAARLGADLVLSGHTHGGQIGVPLLADWVNVASITGQYASGVFRERGAYLNVSAGLGTTGLPLRLGVPPEICLITLRCAEEQSAVAADGVL